VLSKETEADLKRGIEQFKQLRGNSVSPAPAGAAAR
jgi:hypothetical protein